MKILRKTLAYLGWGGFVFFAGFALVYLGAGLALSSHTITNGEAINREFQHAAIWVDAFALRHGRLPQPGEWQAWAQSQPETFYWLPDIEVLRSPQYTPDELPKACGPWPNGGYVLQVWRGEWFESFCSWKKLSSVDSPLDLWMSTPLVSLLLLIACWPFWILWRRCRLH
jgi:hypothetical protein